LSKLNIMSEENTTTEAAEVAEEGKDAGNSEFFTHTSKISGKTYVLCQSPTGMHFFANKGGPNSVKEFPAGHHIVENDKNGFPYCKKKKD
jgi:hypothetical protein